MISASPIVLLVVLMMFSKIDDKAIEKNFTKVGKKTAKLLYNTTCNIAHAAVAFQKAVRKP